MNANAKRKLLCYLAALALVAVVGYALRDSILIQYHKVALTVKNDYAYKLRPFGNFLRAKGIHWQWDVDPHEERDVEALVELGYLMKRDFTFVPPLSESEFSKIHLGAPTTSYKSLRWELSNATIVAVARPDEMPAIGRRVEDFRRSRAATNSPTTRSSELPSAGATGSRSP